MRTAEETQRLRQEAEDSADRANAEQLYRLLGEVGFTRDIFIELGESRRDDRPYHTVHKAVRVCLFRLVSKYRRIEPAYPEEEEPPPPAVAAPPAPAFTDPLLSRPLEESVGPPNGAPAPAAPTETK